MKIVLEIIPIFFVLFLTINLIGASQSRVTNWRRRNIIDDGWQRLLKRENLSPQVTFWVMQGLLAAEVHHQAMANLDSNGTSDHLLMVDELRSWALKELVGFNSAMDDAEQCNQIVWLKFLNLINRYQKLKKNILPYLLAQKDQLDSLCASRVSEKTNYFAQDPYDWLELEDKLYNNPPEEDQPIGNEATLKFMQQLVEIYKNRSDNGSQSRLEKVEALIKVSQLNELKSCTWSAWEELEELEQRHEVDDKNIVPYLQYWREKRKQFCLRYHKTSDMAKIYYDESALKNISETSSSYGKTMKELQELHRFYRNATGNINRWLAAKLEQLLEVSEVSEEKCSNETDWNNLLTLFNIYDSIGSPFILEYLHHWRLEQAKICGEQSRYARDPFDWRPIEQRLLEGDEEGNVTKLLLAIKDLWHLYEGRQDSGSQWRLSRLRSLYTNPGEIQDVCSVEAKVKFIKLFIGFSEDQLEHYLLEGEKKVDESCEELKLKI